MNDDQKLIFSLVIIGTLFFVILLVAKNVKKTEGTNSIGTKQTELVNTPVPETTQSTSSIKSSKTFDAAPSMQIDKTKTYKAVLHTTAGDIIVALFADKTPITVNNFVFLAKQRFYGGVKFHRVIKGFMIQGGDQKGDGTGGPGYKFNDEPFDGEYKRGIIAMANAGPNTNGSQFFIMHQDVALPKNYIIFGKVEDDAGLSVVDMIANAPVIANQFGENSTPMNPVYITSVEIIEQ